ncbi:hypothetical protein [Polynucleobacter bastaniensis]|uniref:hypothetical protein n=1 Tax=Polynucleobacter bastaniensis TaxID=2081039 RepID=UPI001C0CA4A8|nr:hypothetical protein [Polynucleobacter bastaniensis]MBU3598262.1 hypothetical protein [Polynucleobacter bastaniensis]
MNQIEIKFGSTSEDVRQALELYSISFPGGYTKNNLITQKRAQIIQDDYIPSRFIIAKKNFKVVACIRYSIRKIKLGNINFDIIGIGDYCVSKIDSIQPFYGITFLNKSLAILSKLNFPLGIGSGRKIMENYYARFGFITASSYAKCFIEKIEPGYLLSPKAYCKECFFYNRIHEYEKARINTAKNDWGLIHRSTEQWQWILYQVSEMNLYKFIEIMIGNKFIGYFISNKNQVLDFGFLPEFYEDCCKAMLGELIKFSKENEQQAVLPISFDHPAIQFMKGVHLRFEHRFIPNEGIMTVPLNPVLLLDIFSAVSGFSPEKILKDLFGVHREFTAPCDLTKVELSIIANGLFMGTVPPFFVGNKISEKIIRRTFHRINDLDAL